VITSEPEPKIVRWVKVADLPKDLALLESVFWEPDDTVSLRQKIASSTLLKNADVLEIGTGSGLISLSAVCRPVRLALLQPI
jgi:methylase of polypeptide subunit release factors